MRRVRRFWNRWLVRLGRVDPYWHRGTFDSATGWHTAYRLRRSANPDINTDWIETRRWYDPNPTRLLDTADSYTTTFGEGSGSGSRARWITALTDTEIGLANDELTGQE